MILGGHKKYMQDRDMLSAALDALPKRVAEKPSTREFTLGLLIWTLALVLLAVVVLGGPL